MTQDITQRLALFTSWALGEGSWQGYDIGGDRIQDKALELGLLTETTYNPAIHGESEFDAEEGDQWFVFSDELNEILKGVRQGATTA
jgi:hypothetical protein